MIFFIKSENRHDRILKFSYTLFLMLLVFILSCRFYDPFLKPLFASHHIAYFSDYNYIFDDKTCKNLQKNQIKTLDIPKNKCTIDGMFVVKSSIGDSLKLTFDTDTIEEHEITIKKAHILSRLSTTPKLPNEVELKSLARTYININKLPGLSISLFFPSIKKSFSISVSNIKEDPSDLSSSLFELDNTSRGFIIADLLSSVHNLIRLEDVHQLSNQENISSISLLNLLTTDGLGPHDDHFKIVKNTLEKASDETFEKAHKNNRNMSFRNNKPSFLKNLAPTYIANQPTNDSDTISFNIKGLKYFKISEHRFSKNSLYISLPYLIEKFNHIVTKKHLIGQLIYAGYFKSGYINNQKVIYLESSTYGHEILVIHFIKNHYTIGFASNANNHSLKFLDSTTQRLIRNIQHTKFKG